jgi:glycyl-tRNA synthetase
LAPVKCAVLPLKRNEEKLVEKARAITQQLKPHFKVLYDDTGSIGKLYRRQDAIGTPFCVTVDFDTLEDHCVTLRNRDTLAQERIPIDKLAERISPEVSITALLQKLSGE